MVEPLLQFLRPLRKLIPEEDRVLAELDEAQPSGNQCIDDLAGAPIPLEHTRASISELALHDLGRETRNLRDIVAEVRRGAPEFKIISVPVPQCGEGVALEYEQMRTGFQEAAHGPRPSWQV